MVNSGTLTINGNISAAATQRQLYLRGAGNGIINGIIANGTTLNLQIFKDAGNGTIGTGTWTLNGANTFTGGINVTAGTLEFGADANLGATPSTGALAGNGTSATNVVPATGTGSGYSQPAPTVTFSAPPTGGTQAVATTTLGITAANYVINANGSTYTTQPTITFAGGGGAGAAATVAAGGILTVTTAGTGYTSVPTLTFSAGAGLVGPGYSVTSTDATKFCVGSIAFSNAGAGYLTVPTVTFSTGNATLSLLVQGVANLGAGTTLQTKAAVTTARLIALAGAATVNTNGFNSSFTGNIGSTGSLTKIGSGTLALGSANTFTGGSTVNAGVLALTGDLSLGAVPATPTLNLTINGATVQNNGAVTANLNRIFAIGTGGATFNVNSASNFTIQSVIQDVAPGAGTVNVTATGAGLYVPAAQNTYTGGTHLAAGSKSVINSTSTGSATTNDLVSGPYGTGTLFMDGGQQRPTSGGPSSIGNAVQITADSTFIVGVAPTLTFTGPVTLVGGTRTLVTNSVGNIVFAGAIGDAGNNYGLTLGAGSTNTIVLAGVNTYTGTTTITAGTLQLGDGTTGRDGTIATSPSIVNNSALVYNRFGSTTYPGVISGTGTVTMTGVGTQTLSGINTYSGLTTISGGVLSIAASSGIGNASATNTIALSGGATLQSTGAAVDLGTTRSIVLGTGGGTIDVTGTNALTVSGVISGATALTKSSAGTLLLSGSNTTSGAIAVTGGTLSIGASTNLGNAAATNSLTLSNGGALQNTGASVDLGALRMVTLGTGGGTINVTGSNVLTVSGIVSGATNLTKTSSGVLTLTNTNTNTGSVVINGGIVSISASANLGDASATNTLALNNGGTLQSTGAAVDLGANRTVALGTGGGGIDINANNVLTLTAAVSGTGAATDKLIKTGTGELDLLNASNTYVGDTNVNGGTLGGTGVVTASRVFANTSGTIRPGTAATPGTFTVFHADFSGGGTLKNRVTTGQVNDKLVVTAPTTLVMGGTSKLVVDMTGFLVTDQQINYVLADTPSWSPNLAFSNSSVINNSSTLTPANGALAFPNLNYKIVTAGVSQQVLFAVGNATVTPVKITEFAARPEGAGVTLGWTCVSEYQNAGFNLYRQNMGDPEWTRINPALIAGRITNADEKKYSFCDWAEAGEYRYKLESIAIDGTRETYEHIVDAVRVDTVVASVYENEINASGIEAATATLTMVASVENTTRVAASFNVVPMTQPNSMNEPTRREMAAKVRNAPVALVNHAATSPLIAARWFSSGVSSGASNFSGVKVVYKNAGVLSIPTTMVPPGFNVGHVAIQREGRSLTALARTPSSLIVYAQGYQDDYTDKDALFLRTISGATPAGNVSMVSGLFGNGQVANTETQTSAMAEFHDVYFDYDYRPYSFAPWFSGQYLTNGTTQTFALNTPYASSGAASLTVNVWSLTSTINVPTDHALQVVINGHAVGQTQWNGGGKMVALSFQVPSNVLNAGANQVQLITPELNGVNSQICFLHSLTMSYARTTDGTQPVTVTNSGSASALYEVSNVPSAAVWVVDTRFPDRAALVPYEAQAQNDGTYTIRFNAAGGGTGKFLVVPAGSENVPVSVAKCVVKPVKASTYLAVGPAQFSAGVQPLLLKRSKEGLRTAFVDQEQIFNFYNYGRYGPDGIQKAVRSVRPQYLLLVGRTTYDYRNYTGANVDPLCPAFLVSTSFWAQTTSDSMFGDLGRGYPEVAVGRLPVNNGAELGGAVRHILSNTGAPPSGMRGHAISDIADASAGDFSAQALGITQSLPDVTWQTNFLGVTYQTSPEVTAALKSAASGGADLLVYVGHGNAARLGAFNPRILDVDSVQTWTGHAVFVQTTCTANWMAKNVSGYKSIAIQALTQPQGGISASIGTSTYMNSECASAFAEQLLKYADKSGMRWGDALMKTQQWAAAQGSGFYTDLNKTEQIFGDPAMPVFARPTPTSTGASTGSSSLTPATPVVVPGTF
ncbi:MAG: C25 family cysteine peptidase [Planctomycetota bacterium]